MTEASRSGHQQLQQKQAGTTIESQKSKSSTKLPLAKQNQQLQTDEEGEPVTLLNFDPQEHRRQFLTRFGSYYIVWAT